MPVTTHKAPKRVVLRTWTRLDRPVTFSIGIFELFTYAVPGSLYLTFLGYVVARLNWLDATTFAGVPSLLLVVVALLLSYLLGYLAYPLGALVIRWVPRRRQRDYRGEFLRRNPAARGRPYVAADPFLLVSGLQLHDKDAAVEVYRLRAAGLMVRNSAPPLALGAAAAIVELILGHLSAIVVAVVLAGAAVMLIMQARRLSHWANLKTLELCFWLPGVDERWTSADPAP